MRAIVLVSLIIAGSVMTFAQSGSKQTFGANPNLPFSGAVKAGGLIYVGRLDRTRIGRAWETTSRPRPSRRSTTSARR